MENELEEREQINKLIADDIKYLQGNEIGLQRDTIVYFSEEISSPLKKALAKIKKFDTKILTQMSIVDLRNFYDDNINSLAHASRAFFSNPTDKKIQNNLIEQARLFNEFIENITNKKKYTNIKIGGSVSAGRVDISQKINALSERIKSLEEEQKPLNEIIIRNEQNDKRYLSQIDEIKKSVTDLQSSDSQIEINKMLIQTKALFDEATNSKHLINDEVTELKRAKEGHIAYELSKQFGEKCEALKKQKRLHFWMMDIFMTIILLSNSMLWILPIQELFSIKDIELWQHFLVAFSLNLPLIVIVSFHLNEYTKLNKLYEEYENKRIMAATFVNNLKNLKSELQTDEKDLLELIKTPFEKIFDNPVHSIYGDKSGDKNIGLDQLEKFASIFEKIKK